MIAAKHGLLVIQRKRHVVGTVSRCKHAFQRPAGAFDHITVPDLDIGPEFMIPGSIQCHVARNYRLGRTPGPVRTVTVGSGSCRLLQSAGQRRVITVGVGDDDMGDGFPAHCVQQGGKMVFILRTGINDGDTARADNIGIGALERERSGIVAGNAAHLFAQPGWFAGHHFKFSIER